MIRVERSGPVTTVVIDRPEVRNAIDPAHAGELYSAFTEFDADPEARVAVLWGAGGTFCAGADLKAGAAGDINVTPPERSDQGPMGPSRLLLSKPVIAAVAGHAVAGGLELALWCDLRVAEEDAVFGVFCRRWGVPLIDGGTVRLPRLIGLSPALDMILTGRPVGAEEAARLGLANRVVPPGESRRRAEELAAEIARFPQLCMRHDRLSAHEQYGLSLPDAIANEWRHGEVALSSEALTGAARFAAGHGRHGDFDEI
ncbi:MAG: crotonase/enoyl-CoA hydratase family protein [Actinomadura sp.]